MAQGEDGGGKKFQTTLGNPPPSAHDPAKVDGAASGQQGASPSAEVPVAPTQPHAPSHAHAPPTQPHAPSHAHAPPTQADAPPTNPHAPPTNPHGPPSGLAQGHAQASYQPPPPAQHGHYDALEAEFQKRQSRPSVPTPQNARKLGAAPDTNSFVLAALRSFSLKVDPASVRAKEAGNLAQRGITSRSVQAFLLWRRSLLVMVGLLLVPLAILKIVDAAKTIGSAKEQVEMQPMMKDFVDTMSGLITLDAIIFVGFTIVIWVLVGSWASWRKSRRLLFWSWIVYFLAPFAIALYPIRSSFEDIGMPKPQLMLWGIIGSINVIMTLAPKAISLMPGLIRGALATKLLFPGSTSPGWLMILAAPLYAMFVFIVLLVPYQLSGNKVFLLGVISVLIGQFVMLRSGRKLVRPMSLDEVQPAVGGARIAYLVCNGVAILCICIAFADLIEMMELSVLSAINMLLGLLVNIWVLTLLSTDWMVAGLARAREATLDDRAKEITTVFQAGLQEFLEECDRQAPPANVGKS